MTLNMDDKVAEVTGRMEVLETSIAQDKAEKESLAEEESKEKESKAEKESLEAKRKETETASQTKPGEVGPGVNVE